MTARTLKQLGLVAVTLMSATAFSGIPNTDVPLPGTKMQLSDTSGPAGRRTYAALRDGDQSVPVPAPTITGATASIGRVGAGEVTVLDLPASGWSGGTSERRDFKFKSRSGAVVSARLIGGRSIRISARGDGAYPLGGTPQGGVGIIIDVGGVRFCGFFGGTIVKDDGERFVARKAPAPAGCPILGTTTTTTSTSTTTTTAQDCRQNASACDDNDPCTDDACDTTNGTCGHTSVSCDDGNACTNDSCNRADGLCSHTPEDCDDGNACTTDSCDARTGCIHDVIVCHDNDACTTESCNPTIGCMYEPVVCDGGAQCDPTNGCPPTCNPTGTAWMHPRKRHDLLL